MYCAYYITSGLIFNKMTFELFRPSYISQRTITVVENFFKKHQICEIPVFVTIFIYDLMTMLPKRTVHECKKKLRKGGASVPYCLLNFTIGKFSTFCQTSEN